jgi:putative ATP-binding cassette transporter
MDRLGESAGRIELKEAERDSIRIDDLCIAGPEGSVTLDEAHVELKPGERTLIVGEHGVTRAVMLRALLGIWPWGRGQITRPPRQSMMFLPASAYVPPGTLRAALAYPHSPDDYDEAAISTALTAAGLDHLRPLLDTTQPWEKRLSKDEQQNLTFARVLLHRPRWLVMDGALDKLEPALRRRLEAFLAEVGTCLVNIGPDSAQDGFVTRRLRLVTDPHGATFRPVDHFMASAAEGA